MTKILNLAFKIKGVIGRVAHVKSSDPATPPKIWNVHHCTVMSATLSVYIPVRALSHVNVRNVCHQYKDLQSLFKILEFSID